MCNVFKTSSLVLSNQQRWEKVEYVSKAPVVYIKPYSISIINFVNQSVNSIQWIKRNNADPIRHDNYDPCYWLVSRPDNKFSQGTKQAFQPFNTS